MFSAQTSQIWPDMMLNIWLLRMAVTLGCVVCAEVSAAFVLSLGSLLTASAVSAATTEKALSSFPAAASAQVPDAAVDQATNQIIAAIKV